MKIKLTTALCLASLALPALAQEYGESEVPWDDQEESVGARDQAQVDVSVDMATPGAGVSFSTFQDGLAPYGEWVTVGAYGRVWRPLRVSAGWRPYYYGRWEWTDEGWLWVSDEPWGWAAYHYGRWASDPYYGWVWIPGYQWAPAWVTWRYGPEYIGWAPLGPGFSVYVTAYPVVFNWWTFVPCNRFVAVPVHTVAFTGGHVRSIWHATQPAPPRAVVYGGAPAPAWGGPARPFVEHRIGRPISPVRVQPVASPSAASMAPARAGVVPVYRPEVRPGPARPGVAMPSGAAPARGWPNPGAAQRPAAPASGWGARGAPPSSGGWRPPAAQAPNRPAAPPRYAPPRGEGSGAPRQMTGAAPYAPRYAPPSGAAPHGGGGARAAPQAHPQGGRAPAPAGEHRGQGGSGGNGANHGR